MDIWSWVHQAQTQLVENGQTRLADIIDDIPTYTVNGQHAKIDALINEALVEARKQPNKWIELFIRHWYLQSQVLHRRNSAGMLNEAIDLLEFAHQDDTRDCPQSVCIVQDLCSCYGVRDGPGFFEERMSVCEETLEKIDPSWPCYACIGSEYVNALNDSGQYERAIEFIRKTNTEIRLRSNDGDNTELDIAYCDSLMKTEEHVKAEEYARKMVNPGGGTEYENTKSLIICQALAHQKKYDQAIDECPHMSVVIDQISLYKRWCELVFMCGSHSEQYNTTDNNHYFNHFASTLLKHGAFRDTFRIKLQQAHLATLRGDHFTSAQCLDVARSLIPKLNRDMGAQAAFDEANEKSTSERTKFVEQFEMPPLDEIETKLAEEDHQSSLTEWEQWHNAHPTHEGIMHGYANELRNNGFNDHVKALYLKSLERNPDNSRTLNAYGFLMIDLNKDEELDEFFDSLNLEELSEETSRIVLWLKAHRYRYVDPETALGHLTTILKASPEARNSLHFAADLSTTLKKFDLAEEYFTRLINLDEELAHMHWDRLVPATLNKNWSSVRESCEVLEINLSTTEGEVAEHWEVIKLRIDAPDGPTVYARRTGPVSAQVISISRLDETQYYGYNAVFDARPLNKLDQTDEEGDKCDENGNYQYIFDAVSLERGLDYRVVTLDGAHPGDENINALSVAADKLGAVFDRRSSEEYTVVQQESNQELPGLYAYILFPEDIDPLTIHALLTEQTSQYDHPLIWPLLLEMCGLTEELKAQQAIEEQYGLS